MQGYDYIIPVVTHDKYFEGKRTGAIVNMGFMPPEYLDQVTRVPMMLDTSDKEIVGMVTKNDDLKKFSLFKTGGNVKDEQRYGIYNLNLYDIANFSTLSNSQNHKVALVERLDCDSTSFDKNDPMHYKCDLNGTFPIPFPKVSLYHFDLLKRLK